MSRFHSLSLPNRVLANASSKIADFLWDLGEKITAKKGELYLADVLI